MTTVRSTVATTGTPTTIPIKVQENLYLMTRELAIGIPIAVPDCVVDIITVVPEMESANRMID